MKTAFKVFSILLLILYSITAIVLILSIAGVSALTSDKGGATAAIGGLAILTLAIPLISAGVGIYMTICGLKQNYSLCFKIAAVFMILEIVSFIMSESKSTAIIPLVSSVAYCIMAKKMDSTYF